MRAIGTDMKKIGLVFLLLIGVATAQTKLDIPTQTKGVVDSTRVSGVVKTVNGQPPDGAGAITINTGSGNVLLNGTSLPSDAFGNDGDFYLRTTTSCIYGPKAGGAWPASCTSLIGPQGPAGATGNTGATGPAGSNGTNGSSVLNGTGAPASGTGANGDFYLRTDTTCLYGPKSGGAWAGCTTLVGPQGATGTAGTNGNTVLNGTGVPGAGLGANGDYYLRNDTSCIYGPKAAGAWPGSCTSLIGPQGPSGTAAAGGSTLQLQYNNAGNLAGIVGSTMSAVSGVFTLQPQADAGYVYQCFNGTNTAKIVTIKDKTGTILFEVNCASGPTLLTPTIASYVNANHNHQSAAGGGALDVAAIATGAFAKARQHAATVYNDQANTIQPATDATALTLQCFNGTNTAKVFSVKDKTGATLFDVDCNGGPATFTAKADPSGPAAGQFWFSSSVTPNSFSFADGAAVINRFLSINTSGKIMQTVNDYTNAGHNHSNAAGGGQLAIGAIGAGSLLGNGSKLVTSSTSAPATQICAELDTAGKLVPATSNLPCGSSNLADPGTNGIIKRTAVNVTAKAGASDIAAEFTGTGPCYLNKDGTCSNPAGSGNMNTGSANTMGASGTIDLSAAGANALIPPKAAGISLSTEGALGYDTTQHKPVYYDGTSVITIGAGGASFDPSDVATAYMREEFPHTSTSTGSIGTNGWSFAVVNGGTCTKALVNGQHPHMGIIRIGSTGGTNGQGCELALDSGSVGMFGNLSANTNWQSDIIFRMNAVAGTTTNIVMRVGLTKEGQEAQITPTDGVWLRFSTDASDTNFTFEARGSSTSTGPLSSGVAADNLWHHLVIKSATAGEVRFKLDSGSEYCFTTAGSSPGCAGGNTTSANVPTANMAPLIQIIQASASTTAVGVDIDFFSFKFTGVSR
jgi:hypothetical protein